MEPRFGADCSSVRVHTGSEAVQMNHQLGAQAFTHGSDVYFGAGKSPGNNELTAHELTHVVQQNEEMVQRYQQQATDIHLFALDSTPFPSIQRITHIGTPIDINTLNLDQCKEHRGRLMRIKNGASKGTDSEYTYDPTDLAELQKRIKTLESAELEVRRLAVVAYLSGQLATLATVTDFTHPPTWTGSSPMGAEGPEVFSPQTLQPDQVVARWQTFLGAGPYSHKHPRTGVVDNTRLVSADGQRSIRYGSHEQNSDANLHHFHEETWNYNLGSNTLTVSNVVRRVPVK
jgi:hypothetical protein